jgi:integrase/recombinase XerD
VTPNYPLKTRTLRIRQRRGFDFSSEFSTSPLRTAAILAQIFMRFRGPTGLAGQRRNYSSSTTRGYLLAVRQFAECFHQSPEKLGAEEVRRFQLYLLQEKKLAAGTVEIRMSALRFLYKKTLKRRDIGLDDLIFPKTPQKLPVVLSPEEVTRMIEAARNRMHRTILLVLYGTGMRRTEASLLKVSDIDSQRMVIHIPYGPKTQTC